MAISVRENALDNSRLDILQAAAKCFMERGYAAASIDEGRARAVLEKLIEISNGPA